MLSGIFAGLGYKMYKQNILGVEKKAL